MSRPLGQVCQVQIIRFDPAAKEHLEKGLHRWPIVIDSFEQDRLIAQGYARVGQTPQRFLGGRRQFSWMIEVDAEKQRMILFQPGAKLRSHPLGQDTRDPRADPDDLHMGNAPDFPDDVFQAVIAKKEGIAPGEDDIPDFGMCPDVVKSLGDGVVRSRQGCPYLALSGAEPTIHRTLR